MLQRDQLVIPGGDTQIEEGDRVVLFAHTRSRPLRWISFSWGRKSSKTVRLVGHILGFLAIALGAFMLPPLLLALWDGTPDRLGLFISCLVSLAIGGALAGLDPGGSRVTFTFVKRFWW